MSDLRPVALITGASSGIGAALARELSAHGHELVLVARDQARLSALADMLAADGRPRPHALAVDLVELGATDRIADALSARGVEPAIVVNSAGFGLRGHATELDREAQLKMIDLNVRAFTDLSLRFIDAMARHRGGILNVASLAGFYPGPGMAIYYASKAYGLALSEALHHELAGSGVKVTVVCPGPVHTAFHARAGIAEGDLPGTLVRSADRVAREAYRGFVRGRRLVIPGFSNKVAAALPRFLSRDRVLALIEKYQLGPRIS